YPGPQAEPALGAPASTSVCRYDGSPSRSALRMLSLELLGKVPESAPDAIVIVDTAGIILFASRQITILAG
ncbi:MAG: hypothetical protein ACRDRN_27685, partial [Sciscionella sp.]